MITIDVFYDYCLNKKGVTEHFPFDQDTLVFKVGGKMFALSSLKGWENGNPTINLKCDPEWALELREQYSAIQPGYHMSKIHWNTIAINHEITNIFAKQLIDHSYELVFKSLTKKDQENINNLENL
jgi:predicted DNA-binding protein (MmcQ/YjbR family)